MKKKRGLVLSIFLMILGLALISYEPLMSKFVLPKQIKKTYTIDLNVTAENMEDNLKRLRESKEQDELFDYGSVRTLTSRESKPISGHDDVIGLVYAPSVNMELPIKYGVTESVLQNSAGTMKPNQIMGEGNYVLIGHNHFNPNVLFAPIRNIEKGDSIFITDKRNVYEYEMQSSKVVQPEEVDVINDVKGKELLTLISCYSADGSDRIVVQAELVSIKDYE